MTQPVVSVRGLHKYFGDLGTKPESTNERLRLLWLGVGNEDFLYERAVAFRDLLAQRRIRHRWLQTGGGHTWMNARTYLAETLQLFFR